jgi:hypothetical protein
VVGKVAGDRHDGGAAVEVCLDVERQGALRVVSVIVPASSLLAVPREGRRWARCRLSI